MQYAIELFFDEKTEKEIKTLAEKVAENGISTQYLDWKTSPHVALACFNDVDEERCKELLNEFASEQNAIDVTLASVGMFTDTKVIFLSPVMTSKMYDIQRKLHEKMSEFDTTGWDWYCPDNWVPHCTVAYTSETTDDKFYEAADLILHLFTKPSGKFNRIGLVKITHPVQEMYTLQLKD